MTETRRAIVTGGAGFIGSHLVDLLLNAGHSVTVIDNLSTGRRVNLDHCKGNPKLKFVEADITDFGAIAPHFKGCDWVFHLAALADIVPSIERPTDYFQANVVGTENVLEAARAAGVRRFVYSASSSCYGLAEKHPTPEDAPIRPQYPYALTKRIGEELLLHWTQVYGMPAVSLRFFNVYGPRSRTSGTYGAVFGVFLAQKIHGKPYTVVGDGKQTRDFTYVTDIAAALLKAAESDAKGEVFNVGSGNTYSVNRLVKLLGGPVTFIPKRPGEPDCTFADISKIRSRLGWEPKVSLEEGVRRILEHIDYWREAPVWTPKTIGQATKKWFRYLSPEKEKTTA